MIKTRTSLNFQQSKWAWWLMGLSLAIVVGLVFIKEYSLAGIAVVVITIIASLIKPVYGVVIAIAYFTCDQFISGISPDTLTFGRYLIILNIIFCLPKFLSHSQVDNSIGQQFYLYFLLLFLGSISLIWAEHFDRGAIYLMKLAVFIVWGRLVIPLLANKELLTSLSGLMCVITSLIALIFLFGGVGRVSHINDRLLLEGLGINSIATSFGFVIVFSSLYFRSCAPLLRKLCLLISNMLIYLAIILMGTRSVAFGVPFALIAAVFFLKPEFLLKHLSLAIIVAGLSVAGLLVAVHSGLISERLYERFFGLTDIQVYTKNSRVDLAKHSISYVLNNPIGSGVGSEHKVFENYSYNVPLYESHNTYVSTMVQFGLQGFFVLLTALALFFINNIKISDPKYRYYCISLLIYFLIILLKASLLQTRLFWIPMIIMLASVEWYNRSKKRKGIPDCKKTYINKHDH